MAEEGKQQPEDAAKELGANFKIFITGLGMQALISMGDIPSPVDNKVAKNMDQAKYMIDTLDIIKQKTKGNLTSDEEEALENILYELRMRYIELESKEKGQ